MSMFHSVSKLLRGTFRSKSTTFINIIGLSVGLAVAMFLIVYLQFEFSYDRHFKDGDRIYRVLSVWEEDGGKDYYPINFEKLAENLVEEIPEVEVAAKLYNNYGESVINYEGGENISVETCGVDSTFFKIFQFQVLYGDIENALNDLSNCVITRTTSELFFGYNINPVGLFLTGNSTKRQYKVAAVIEDIPANTHFNYDVLYRLPKLGYGGLEYFTYVKLYPGSNHQHALAKINALNKNMLETRFDFAKFNSYTEPLYSLHTATKADFDLSPTVNKANLIFIILVAVFILGIAISNFISLYIIQGEQRATEISVRKTNGAQRGSIIKLLFNESFLITFISFILAAILYFAFSSYLSGFIDFNMPPNMGITWQIALIFILLFVIMTLCAALYPVLYLSRYSPSDLIRKSTVRKYRMTTGSVIIQFSIVVFCISALIIVNKQLNYIKNLPLGFESENIITVNASTSLADYEKIKSEFLQYPDIVAVSLSQGHPISGCSGQNIRKVGSATTENVSVDERRTGPGYLELYNISILEGRNFSENLETERKNIIVTESVVKSLELENPIGTKVIFVGDTMNIIGVAKDIYYKSVHEKMGKLVYSAYNPRFYLLSVKYKEGKYTNAKSIVDNFLEKSYSGVPIATYDLGDIIKNQYAKDNITFRILVSGTFLGIFLALLGLFSLSRFVARQKRKEIGVRRVFGANVEEIVYDMNRFITLKILPAIPIGIIISYFAMRKWLDNFEYAVTQTWVDFVLTIFIVILIALLTIFYQSFTSARTNPAETLKYE